MSITVLLADSVAVVRQVERSLLESEPGIEVVGEADNEPHAMMLIKACEPQIVVIDFNVRSTGETFPKKIKSRHPKTKVLGVTEIKGRYVKNFLKLFGADELLDRKDLETKLTTTVRSILSTEAASTKF